MKDIIRKTVLTTFLLLLSMAMSAQFQTDSAKIEKYRKAIGLEMTIPDYRVKKIDDAKMGVRLANILRFFEESLTQGQYNRLLTIILGEQHEELQHSYFSIKKVKLQSAIKKGDDIVVVYKIWPEHNDANVTQTDVVFHFLNGVSESKNVNELFSTMSHYVQAREYYLNIEN